MTRATTLDGSFVGPSSATQPSRFYLVVREPERTRVIDLDDGADIVLGRSSSATVQLDDDKLSRQHARVVRHGDAVDLVDLGSKNGTYWNGELVGNATRRLRSGDVVRLGKVEILVAETAGVEPQEGTRIDRELARVLSEAGQAALVTFAASEDELVRASPALVAVELVERQPDGQVVCVVDGEQLGALTTALNTALPHAALRIARAPADGRDAATLLAPGRPPSRADKARATAALPGVVVGDPAMVRVFERVRKVAPTPTTVLILGETGVGKEVIAEELHRLSPRAGGPFVRLNCGSLPESLIESELFGHEKGAFTGADKKKIGYIEAAHGGTLFLDEIGELPLGMQTRLLRVLESHQLTRVGGRDEIAVDLRVVAATNRNLEEDAKAGRFRSDLYFRLAPFILRVPPLRERAAEIELLAELFVRQFARRMNVAPPTITEAAMNLLRRHPWPGNVRELRNAMEHAVVVVEGSDILADALPDSVLSGAQGGDTPSPGSGGSGTGPMREQLADLERRQLAEALDAESGNQTRAAKRLGISRRALQYKMEKYNLKS